MKVIPFGGPQHKPKKKKPGQVPEGRIGVFDGKGRMRGHVGPLATANVCNRFGVSDAKLGKKNGRNAWLGR